MGRVHIPVLVLTVCVLHAIFSAPPADLSKGDRIYLPEPIKVTCYLLLVLFICKKTRAGSVCAPEESQTFGPGFKFL